MWLGRLRRLGDIEKRGFGDTLKIIFEMSADNGIYIAEFPDGFRVVHTQAIDNLHFHEADSKEWHQTIEDYYGEAGVFTKEKAYGEALRLEKKAIDEMGFTEYGICSIGFFDHKFDD